MRTFTVLIVDDERPARANIARLLGADPRFCLVGEARNGLEALQQIDALQPDLVFLDVQMPGPNGFEVLEAIGSERHFEVVFSTAFDEFALRAFDSHAVDYLLKPYDPARFQKALQRAYSLCNGAAGMPESLSSVVRSALPPTRDRLTLRSVDRSWVTISLSDVVCLVGTKRCTRIVLRKAEHTLRVALGELSAKLDDRFVRTHRSEVVNVEAVRRVEQWTHGDAILEFDNGATRVLTRTYRKEFMDRYIAHGQRP